jgi:hypothetical protein
MSAAVERGSLAVERGSLAIERESPLPSAGVASPPTI